MKKKIQFIRTWENGEQWYVVREVDGTGNVIFGSNKYFQKEEEAQANYVNRVKNGSVVEVLQETEIGENSVPAI